LWAGEKDKRLVERLYDETADIYDERYAESQRVKYVVVEDVLRGLTGSCLVLDVGGGTGLLSSFLSGARVVTVDRSRGMLSRARGVLKVRADADLLPFEDSRFDIVCAFTLLQNMPDPRQTLVELLRVTKRGGWLVFSLMRSLPVFGLVVGLVPRFGRVLNQINIGGETVFIVRKRRVLQNIFLGV